MRGWTAPSTRFLSRIVKGWRRNTTAFPAWSRIRALAGVVGMSGRPPLARTKTQALPLAGWVSACALTRDGAGLATLPAPLGDVEIRPDATARFVLDPACLLRGLSEGRTEEASCRESLALISTEQGLLVSRQDGLPALALLPLVNMRIVSFQLQAPAFRPGSLTVRAAE